MVSTVYQMVEHMERNYAEQIAFQYYSESDHKVVQVTFAQYCEDIRNYAFFLKRNLPDIEGMHIGIVAKSNYRYMVCLLGIMLAKAVAVPINIGNDLETILKNLEFADVSKVLTDDDVLRTYQHGKYKDDMLPINGLSQENGELELRDSDNNREVALMIFTSGTTDKNKCVMISQENIFAHTWNLHEAFLFFGLEMNGEMVPIPLYHIAGLTSVLWINVFGRRIDLCPSIKDIYHDLSLMKSDFIIGVPALLNIFHKDIVSGKGMRLSGLKVYISGGAFINPNVYEAFSNHGISIIDMYGMTESSGGGCANMLSVSGKFNSVGKVSPGGKLKIVDGEVCYQSKEVMLGYYKDEEATKEAIRNGWLHTGDLGYLDEDGFLYLTGRKKNLIILSNGENVSSEEIEGELLKNPDVWETIVREKNDKICAVIYCAPEKQEQIRNYISEENRGKPLWKRITEVEFREKPFEKTGTGKIIRSL